jgi:hypothetical protein
MEKYHEEVYNYFEDIEEQKEKIRRRMSRGKVGNDNSTYSSYTRQSCNFVFPRIDSKIDGEQRPRPGKFRITDQEAVVIDEGKDEERKRELLKLNKELAAYVNAIKVYINGLIDYFKEIHRKDKENKHTIQDDVKLFKTKYNSSFTKFFNNYIKII